MSTRKVNPELRHSKQAYEFDQNDVSKAAENQISPRFRVGSGVKQDEALSSTPFNLALHRAIQSTTVNCLIRQSALFL